MRASPFIAVGLILAASAWIGSAYLGEDPAPSGSAESKPIEDHGAPLATVRTRVSEAATRMNILRFTGRTEAKRRIDLKVETEGRITELAFERGDRVRRGHNLVRVALNDRSARLTRAEARMRQRQLEFEAAQTLARKDFRSETDVAGAQARLEAAQAALAAIRIELSQTAVAAPFGGVIESKLAEQGDYLQKGDPVATLVDLDPIVVVAAVPEHRIHHLTLGQVGRVNRLNGESVTGVVSFIGSTADANTRTFRIELEVDNADLTMRDGLTSEILLPVGSTRAHFIPRSVITLDDDGRIGVRVIAEQDLVRFMPIEIIADAPTGFWVTGLPPQVTLITVGQEWVRDGSRALVQPDPNPGPAIPDTPLLSEANPG